MGARQCSRPFTSRPRFFQHGDGTRLCRRIHGALRLSRVGGALTFQSRRRPGVFLTLPPSVAASFTREITDSGLNEDHFMAYAGLEEARVRPLEVDHGQARLCGIADDRLPCRRRLPCRSTDSD